MSIICPHCGSANLDTAGDCAVCGGNLHAPPAAAQPFQTQPRPAQHAPETYPCPSCGFPNDPNAGFCVNCGQTVALETEPVWKDRLYWLRAVLITATLIMLAICGLIALVIFILSINQAIQSAAPGILPL
ncbi:MAG TPA: zinc ribbon domain-containing protein [Anaerolineales bacterium]|nr:zinc ribbon domain-containing protein [Anaerolineales bacterium]